MEETGYRMKEYDILAFCLCFIKCSEPFQLSSRVKEMDISAESPRSSGQNVSVLSQNILVQPRFNLCFLALWFPSLIHQDSNCLLVQTFSQRDHSTQGSRLWQRYTVLLSLSDCRCTTSSRQPYHDAVNTSAQI